MDPSVPTETKHFKRAKTDANQANNSAASENGGTMDRRAWSFLGFTDEIDRRDFGGYWKEVEKLKYNNPGLKSLRSIIPRVNPRFCREAWIRLGWYLKKNDFIEEVDFQDLDFITDEVLVCMFGSVIWTPKKRIKSMNFCGCSITFDGIKRLLPFIEAAPSISNFFIGGNNIETEGFGLVATALCGRRIEELSFQDCAINDIIPTLTQCKFPELKRFYLYDNHIGDKGAEFIADKFLQSCPKLERLGLGNCEISDRGAKSIADALASNTTLKVLCLGGNNISHEGVASFTKALLSNHTLMSLNMTGSTVGWSDTKCVKARYFAKDGDGLECAMCLQKKCEFFVFLPCGHKICTDCNDVYDKDICHMCIEKFETRQRLN